MAMGRWGQEMWLSDRDFLTGVTAAITVEGIDFAAVNLMSNNPGMRWNIDETRSTIGYVPQDGSPPIVTPAMAVRSGLKKLFTETLPQGFERLFPSW